jgi:hypothetical protein
MSAFARQCRSRHQPAPTISSFGTYSSSACRDVSSWAIAETRFAVESLWWFENGVDTSKWRGSRFGGHGALGRDEGVYGNFVASRLIQGPMAGRKSSVALCQGAGNGDRSCSW